MRIAMTSVTWKVFLQVLIIPKFLDQNSESVVESPKIKLHISETELARYGGTAEGISSPSL
jgi:hypothetical protein